MNNVSHSSSSSSSVNSASISASDPVTPPLLFYIFVQRLDLLNSIVSYYDVFVIVVMYDQFSSVNVCKVLNFVFVYVEIVGFQFSL